MKLHLQKKSGGVELTIKSRPPFFTKDLMIAFVLALLLHLSAFFLFHIDLNSFFSSKNSPSLLVTSDFTTKTYLDSQEESTKIPSILKINSSQFPSHTPFAIDLPSQKIALSSSPIDLSGFDLKVGPKKSRFYISRGHSFAEHPESLFSKKLCRAALEFKASTKTGEIFWVRWLESTQNPQLDCEILSRIKNARIQPFSDSGIALSGIIEVEFAS